MAIGPQTLMMRLSSGRLLGGTIGRKVNELTVGALGLRLFFFLFDVGGRGLTLNGAIAGVAHLLKIKTYLRKGG